MRTEDLGNARFLNLLLKPAGLMMGSRLRERVMDPAKTLQGAELQPGQSVLEVGCGTGFFTIPAARMIGEQGRLIAMDPMASYLEMVSKKLRDAELTNVRVMKRDALETGLESASIEKVLLFGVIPFPSLPLSRLLPEMHRVLEPKGTMAVWLFPVSGWIPRSIVRSGLFEFIGRKNRVYNYRRV